jgi:mono/diheme cytochrome c family protein
VTRISTPKSRVRPLATCGLVLGAALSLQLARSSAAVEENRDRDERFAELKARVIATGIPGAGAVTEVGDFLTGSPLHDKAAFVPFTASGRVLAPARVLVASTSNFGAPLARPDDPEGTILSIDPANGDLAVPAGFAAAGGQASTLGGAVQVYTAQSPAFLNSVTEPLAATRDLPSASLPTGISLNNGNGRPWLANAPNGAGGDGTITVLDPQGFPLAGAPDPVAGGVFSGNETNRAGATHGLTSAALGTAILTKSPDLTGRAVFAAVEADGSVVQVNVLKGVDGLAPAGTVTPLALIDRATAESSAPHAVAREGIVFNWVPTRNLFVADPQANRLVVLDLTDDGMRFAATLREIRRSEFDAPIDLAPATREVAAGSFASNTTLGGGSDLYVLNRGNNTIVRMTIGGHVQAVRRIDADIDDWRANGIAVASDGQVIYVTGTTPGGGGVLLSVPAFGASRTTSEFFTQARSSGMTGTIADFSRFVFTLDVTPEQGLGPLFNGQSCVSCHSSPTAGGMGTAPGQTAQFVGRLRHDGTFDPLVNDGGPVARLHSIAELGVPCGLPTGVPPEANVVSLRNAMALRGDGLLDDVALGDVLSNMVTEPIDVRGHPNMLPDGRMGKFGWKANVATLVEFMGNAFRNEMGLTNPLQPRDEVHGCGATRNHPDVDALALELGATFLNSANPPVPPMSVFDPTGKTPSAGQQLFQAIGCASCHAPQLPGPGARAPIYLFSDLLLHEMGPALADQMQQGSAKGNEWRTMPLWRASERGRFLHDGRALTLADAIAAHGGQAQHARDLFLALASADKDALVAFLNGI